MYIFRHLLLAAFAMFSTLAVAAPVKQYTFDVVIAGGSNSVGTSFQEVLTLPDFLAPAQTFDFGGGTSMVRASIVLHGVSHTGRRLIDQMAAVFDPFPYAELNGLAASARINAELAYYLPQGNPSDAGGQVRISSTGSRLIPTGNGDFYYDNFGYEIAWLGNYSLDTFDPSYFSQWFEDIGTFQWSQYASRVVCETPTQGPCGGGSSVQWHGAAKLAGVVTLQDPSEIPEPATLALVAFALLGLGVSRKLTRP